MRANEHPNESAYAEAIGQLMAAAQRTRDSQAWLTLTTLAEMFIRLDRRHRAGSPASAADLAKLYSSSGAEPAN